MACKWAYITSLAAGDAKLALYRTIKPSIREGETCPTYGYFIKVYFKGLGFFKPSSYRETTDKIPQKLLPFLRRMITEFEFGRTTAGTTSVDDKTYTLVPIEGKKYQLRFPITNSSEFHDINMTMNDLKHLASILEMVNILLVRQKGRCLPTDEDYPKLLEELMGWATAKMVHIAVSQRLGPGRQPETQQEYDRLWEDIKREEYTQFLDDLERFARRIKIVLPINDPHLTSYDDKYVSTGFRYSKPYHEYEPLQLLVDVLHTPGMLIPTPPASADPS